MQCFTKCILRQLTDELAPIPVLLLNGTRSGTILAQFPEFCLTFSVEAGDKDGYYMTYTAEYTVNNRVHTAYTKLIVIVEG